MDRKVLLGLLAVGAAALAFSSRGGGRRPAAHAERFAAAVAEARGHLARGRAALGKGDYAFVAATVRTAGALVAQAKAERIAGQNLPDHVTPLTREVEALRAAHAAACTCG